MTTNRKNKTAEMCSTHVNAWKKFIEENNFSAHVLEWKKFQWVKLNQQEEVEKLVTKKKRPKNWRYEITPENAENINPIPYNTHHGKKVLTYATPINPAYNLAQIVFDRKEAKAISEGFQIANAEKNCALIAQDFSRFVSFGWCIYRKCISKNKMDMDFSYLRYEIVEAATSAAINFCANYGAKEIEEDGATKKVCDASEAKKKFAELKKLELKNWPKEIFANAFRDADKLVRKMANTNAVEPSYFSALDAEIETPDGIFRDAASSEQKKKFVEIRFAELAEKIARNGEEKKSKRKSACVGRAMKFLERSRDFAFLAIDSEKTKLTAPKMFQTENETYLSTVVTTEIKTGNVKTEVGKQLRQKTADLKRSAQWKRNARFEKIIGVDLNAKNQSVLSLVEKDYSPKIIFGLEKKGFLEKIIGMTKAEIEACKKSGAINPPEKVAQENAEPVVGKWIRKPIQFWDMVSKVEAAEIARTV